MASTAKTAKRRHSKDAQQPRRGKTEAKQKTRKNAPAASTQEDYIAVDFVKIARALLARMLFIIHSLITIWQTVEVYKKQAYWSFSLITIAILIEGAVTLLQRGGDESRWFCPCVFLFVLSTVPPIWFLELDLSKTRLEAYSGNSTNQLNQHASTMESTFHIGHELSVQLVEQFLLVVLIVGRWMLPKGVITREQLSQILLAYLAIASDIVELFDVFKESAVVRNLHLRYMVLAIWSTSLFQFPFVLTASKARKMRIAITQSSSDEELKRIQSRITAAQGGRSTFTQILHDADIWAIILANFLQDIPFLVVRLYLMLGYGVITYTMIFFTCKNALIIALQTYRLFILIHDRYQKPTPEDDARRLARHYRYMLSHCKEALAALKQSHPSVAGNKGGSGGPDEPTEPSGGTIINMEASGSRQNLQSPSQEKASHSPGGDTTKRRHNRRRQREDSIQEVEAELEQEDRNKHAPSPATKKRGKRQQDQGVGEEQENRKTKHKSQSSPRRHKHRDSKTIYDKSPRPDKQVYDM